MRTLSATLTAAQKAASRAPYVEVRVRERVADVSRLRWASAFTDGAAPDDEHDAFALGVYLHRARVRAGNAQYERNAGTGWTTLSSAADANRVAIDAIGTRVMVVYSRGAALYFRESTDEGATFGAETLILSLGATPAALSLAYKTSGGDLVVLWEEGNAVKRIRRTGGSFGTAATWTNSMNSVNGLAVDHFGDFDVIVTGVDTDSRAVVMQTQLGDGFSVTVDTWRALAEIAGAEDGSNVTYLAPSMKVLDTHRLAFVEKYTGTVAYARAMLSWVNQGETFAANVWREPVPFDESKDQGVAVAAAGNTAYLSRPDEVWTAVLGGTIVDLTADVLEVELQLEPEDGRVVVVLRNDDGRFNDLPNGAYPQITFGAQVEVSPGYTTENGNERSSGMEFWIEGWERRAEPGRSTFWLYARDGWSLLRRWRSRQQWEFDAGQSTISAIFRFVVSRAGLVGVDAGQSATAGTLRPEFTIHAGDDGLTVLRRLLAMVPDVVLMKAERAEIKERLAGDASVYAYGTDHALYRGRYGTFPLAANVVRVFGDGVYDERFDFGEILERFDAVRQVFDLNVDSAGEVGDLAGHVLRREELAAPAGRLDGPPNVGHELYDVVAVTDARAGLTSERFRVQGWALQFRRERGSVYLQQLVLGKP